MSTLICSIIQYHRGCNKNNMTGATIGGYPS